MQAGTLRHQIEIQSHSATADELNQIVITEGDWSTDATRWAAIQPMSGRELEHNNAVYADVSHKITLRHYDLTTEDRIKYGTRIFNIISVINIDERNREITVIAKEVV